MSTAIALAIGVALVAVPAAAGQGLTIARRGQSAYQIIVPNDATQAISYAAAELQRFIGEASGAKLPVVGERQAKPGPAFLIGPSERVRETGLIAEAETLTGDGVLIKTVGSDIILLGSNDRGQLYSVYVLLERFMGCRFLAPDCNVVPKRTVLTLPRIDYSHSPPFIYREQLYNDTLQWSYAARLRLNGSNMTMVLKPYPEDNPERVKGVLIFPFVHSAYALVPPDKYLATHPEYFSLVNGQRLVAGVGAQLCWTNPDVLRICTDQVMKWLEEQPGALTIDVSQNDAYPGSSGACECENCAAVVREEGSQSGPVLRFVNAIAAKVAEKYPGRYVDTLAYDYTITSPKVTKPLPNVIIRLCHYACYFHGIEGEDLSANLRAACDDWGAVAKNVWVWHYGTNFWHYLAPNPNLTSLAKDIKYYAAHGVNGLMLQGDLQGTGGEQCTYRQYLAAQLMWDPAQDPMAIRSDFCKGYYGRAKGEVWDFLALMDRWAASITRHIPTNGWNPPDVTPREVVDEAMGLLDRAYAKTDDPVIRNRVEKLMVPFWYVRLSWPDAYGVSKEDCAAILQRFKRVCEANSIGPVAEWGPPTADWVKQMEATYPPKSG